MQPCSLNDFIALEGAWKKARGDVLVEGAHIDPFLKSPRTQNQHRTLSATILALRWLFLTLDEL